MSPLRNCLTLSSITGFSLRLLSSSIAAKGLRSRSDMSRAAFFRRRKGGRSSGNKLVHEKRGALGETLMGKSYYGKEGPAATREHCRRLRTIRLSGRIRDRRGRSI